MENQQLGVYKLFSLGRLSGNSFDKEIKVIQRDLHVVTNDYALDVNVNSHMNGLFYEKDEKASKLYYEGKEFASAKEYTTFEEVKVDEIEVVAPVVVIKEKAEVIKVKATKAPLLNGTVDQLKAQYLELSGKKPGHLWGVVKLSAEINNLITN